MLLSRFFSTESALQATQPAPAPASLRWPGLAQMRGATHNRRTNIGRQIRLAWGLLTTLPFRARFNAVLQRHPHWQPVFAQQAKSFEPLVQSFIDRRFNVAQRFRHLQHDLAAATRAFGVTSSQRIATGEHLVLWDLAGAGQVCLGLNPLCRREGLWALSLRTAAGVRVCQISFSFLHRGRLMIGSVQGAAMQDAHAQQGIRDLTRAAQGLRSPYLLVAVLRVICQRDAVALLGVDPQHHVKKRWHQASLAVCFDYRAFWAGLGGHCTASGIWALPEQRAPRAQEDVPAKRRAQHKRRLALLAGLPQHLRNLPGLPGMAQAA